MKIVILFLAVVLSGCAHFEVLEKQTVYYQMECKSEDPNRCMGQYQGLYHYDKNGDMVLDD
jgi:hypothetical protein